MTRARWSHTATLLRDGRVLIAGGVTDGAPPLATAITAEIHDPTSGTFTATGNMQGAIWDSATGQIASSQNPAVAGGALSTYTASFFEGGAIPPQVSVGGKLAEILYFGDAPGYPGYFQVNSRVPNGAAPGSTVSVRLTYIGRPSNSVTMGVQ
jgi:uncharacterized protein (TIGR03437 family)